MTTLFRRAVLICTVALPLALATAGCSNSDDDSALSSVTTSPSATLVTETFTGSLAANGSAIHPFSVTTSSYSLLAGVTSLTPSTVTSLGLGIGAWDAASSTCGLNLSQNDAAKSGSTALSGTATAGNYCIRVYDGGNIPSDTTVSYTVQVQHY